MFTDSIIIIPARAGSKGFPMKNRRLFQSTINQIPVDYWDRVVVSTDDEAIMSRSRRFGLRVEERPTNLALDRTSVREVLVDLRRKLPETKYCITLYLTYPQRTWEDIENAASFMQEQQAKSLLCKKEVKGTHPFLYMFEEKNHKGRQLVNHDLYRRQDYPAVFEISHYIQMCEWSELACLNENLYNHNTSFFSIKDVVDVDYEKDLAILPG